MSKYDFSAIRTLGITCDDAVSLRRAAMRLHRWYELECGTKYGAVERDEATGKCYWYSAMSGKRSPYKDYETGAVARIRAIMTRYPSLVEYHQTDPRGAPLFILPRDRVRDGEQLDEIYSRGVAVHK